MKLINHILTCSSKRLGLALVLLCSGAHESIFAATAQVNSILDAPAFDANSAPDVFFAGSGIVTFRSAIQYLNAQVQPSNTITFGIAGAGPFVIQPTINAGLDPISVPVTIDGYTQPGTAKNGQTSGDNAILKIVLNGSNYTVGDGQFTGNGLHFVAGSDGSIVKGLVINEWLLNGILIDGSNGPINGIQIVGNFIGTNAAGTAVDANRTGIGISGLNSSGAINPITNTVIGTVLNEDRNILAGSFGYMILDGYNVRGACICSYGNSGTLIKNNYIGTDTSGLSALGESLAGILFIAESGSTIGGAKREERNIISGHRLYGVDFTGISFVTFFNLPPGCSNCTIQGNYVGTDLMGTYALGNGNAGIGLDSNATNNSILANLISGNGVGIRLGQFDLTGSINNTVQGNKIGTDLAGRKQIPNTGFGIIVNDNQNTIGGTSPDQRNLISGNGKGGIFIYGANTDIVAGNYIGTDFTGKNPIPNGGNGVQLGSNGTSFCAATANTIGS